MAGGSRGRRLLVPLKAVIMNLLSIGAAYGVVVALFQWGWLSDVTGMQPAPIESWAPMMLFAIVFGLSMGSCSPVSGRSGVAAATAAPPSLMVWPPRPR